MEYPLQFARAKGRVERFYNESVGRITTSNPVTSGVVGGLFTAFAGDNFREGRYALALVDASVGFAFLVGGFKGQYKSKRELEKAKEKNLERLAR